MKRLALLVGTVAVLIAGCGIAEPIMPPGFSAQTRTVPCCTMFQVFHQFAVHAGPATAYAPAGVGEWDAAVTQDNIATTICVAGYTARIRTGGGGEFGAITDSIKTAVYKRDGLRPDGLGAGRSHCCEIDHYYPLNSGGANDMGNLWAESWDHPFGAHDKDKVEDATQSSICAGLPGYEHTKYKQVTLAHAHAMFASDWIAWGREIGALK